MALQEAFSEHLLQSLVRCSVADKPLELAAHAADMCNFRACRGYGGGVVAMGLLDGVAAVEQVVVQVVLAECRVGRPSQAILFCEIDKYARAGFPHVAAINGRRRIEQGFQAAGLPALHPVIVPTKWVAVGTALGVA